MAEKPNYQAIKEETASQLRQAGVSGARADEVARRIAVYTEDKASGKPVPERFQPLRETRGRR